MNNQIKISLDMIREHQPCERLWRTLLTYKGKTESDNVMFPLSDVVKSSDLEDAFWCFHIAAIGNRELFTNIALQFAKRCVSKMEDERSIKALRACENGTLTYDILNDACDAARLYDRLDCSPASYAADAACAVALAFNAVDDFEVVEQAEIASVCAKEVAYDEECEEEALSEILIEILDAGVQVE